MVLLGGVLAQGYCPPETPTFALFFEFCTKKIPVKLLSPKVTRNPWKPFWGMKESCMVEEVDNFQQTFLKASLQKPVKVNLLHRLMDFLLQCEGEASILSQWPILLKIHQRPPRGKFTQVLREPMPWSHLAQPPPVF